MWRHSTHHDTTPRLNKVQSSCKLKLIELLFKLSNNTIFIRNDVFERSRGARYGNHDKGHEDNLLFFFYIVSDISNSAVFFLRLHLIFCYAAVNMSSIITLFCLVHGESGQYAFSVRLDRDLLISDLKKLIKEEKPNDLRNIDADQLALCKVNIQDEDEDALKNFDPREDDKLCATSQVAKYFSDNPPEEHVHIIIKYPPTSCEYCYIF